MTMKNRNAYIGHPLQLRGAEPYILQGGRGDGMHLLCVRNGLGLEAWISLDRCADLSRVSFGGDNMCISPPAAMWRRPTMTLWAAAFSSPLPPASLPPAA